MTVATASKARCFTHQYACIVLKSADREMVGYAGGDGGRLVLSPLAARKFSHYPEAICWALAHGRDFGPERTLDVVGIVR